MQNRPAYSIASVDRALHLVTILQQEGPLRVTDVAERLGVSESTAHRLLAMLVYRDFARQQPDRRYGAGRVLQPSAACEAPVELLREIALPHLRRLCDHVEESVNLSARAGHEMRFIATVESSRAVRVGDRTGKAVPLHLVSGGRALLANMPMAEIDELVSDSEVDAGSVASALAEVKKNGYAVNNQLSEPEVVAIGAPIWTSGASPSAAISISMPASRASSSVVADAGAALLQAVAAVQAAVNDQIRPAGSSG